jgi:hypothetical protein
MAAEIVPAMRSSHLISSTVGDLVDQQVTETEPRIELNLDLSVRIVATEQGLFFC